MSTDTHGSTARRVIKRYSNRKLYDTRESRYVTLQQIGEMVRRGEDVQVIDNKSKEDKTEATLALILSEDLKSEPGRDQLSALRGLLQERSEKFLSTLRDGPIRRLIPGADRSAPADNAVVEQVDEETPATSPRVPEASERTHSKSRIDELVASSKQTLGELQATLDERVHAVVPGLGLIRSLRSELAALQLRVEEIERQLGAEHDRKPITPDKS